MPSAWTSKDERQYEKIRQSSRRRGRSDERAKEIAARTVNKRRRKEGRTPNKTTQGTGNPRLPLADRTVAELRNLAVRAQHSRPQQDEQSGAGEGHPESRVTADSIYGWKS
jgi:hypothetical protein